MFFSICGNSHTVCYVCTPICFSASLTIAVSVCHAVSPELQLALRPPAHPPTLHSALSPSDRLALCQERLIVFESCQDIKRGRSLTRGHFNNKLATSSKVRGNMTSQSESLIGSGLPCDEGMDGSCFNGVDHCLIHSPPEGNMCFVPIPCSILIVLIVFVQYNTILTFNNFQQNNIVIQISAI